MPRRGPAGAGLGADQQVRRGLPGPPLLRRLRAGRRRRGARDRARQGAVRRRVRQRPAALRRARPTPPCCTRSLDPGDTMLGLDARPRRPPHARHEDQLLGPALRRRRVRRRPRDLAHRHGRGARASRSSTSPKVIIAGWSAYPRQLDFAAFRAIADEVGALPVGRHGALRRSRRRGPAPEPGAARPRRLLDRAQDDRRPALGLHPDQRRRHRQEDQLRGVPGPAGRPAHARDRRQGDRVQARRRRRSSRSARSARSSGAQIIAERLIAAGRRRTPASPCSPAAPTCTSCSSTCATPTLDGKQAEDLLHEIGITVNRNAVPNDPRPPMVTSGLRIGTPALATRGFGDAEFTEVADIIALALLPARRRALRTDVDALPRVPAYPACSSSHRRRSRSYARACSAVTERRERPMTAAGARRQGRRAAADQGRAAPSGSPRSRRAGVVARASAPCSSGPTPARSCTSAGKHRDCAEVGHELDPRDLPADATQARGRGADRRAERRPGVHRATSCSCRCRRTSTRNAILERIDPAKDADGLHPTNLGRLVLQRQRARSTSPLPCTPRGVDRAARRATAIDLHGQARRRRRPRGHDRPHRSVCCSPAARSTRRSPSPTRARWTSPRTPAQRRRRRRGGRRAGTVITADDVKPGAVVLDVGVSRATDPETGKRARRRRRRPRGARGRRLAVAEPRRGRPDDPGDAAEERRGDG